MSNSYYASWKERGELHPPRTRPKAFKSEESADKWAVENGIKDYSLRNLRQEGQKKKIKILLKK